jgi:peptidylprolyl isomerase
MKFFRTQRRALIATAGAFILIGTVAACGDDDTSSDASTDETVTSIELTPVQDEELVGEKPDVVIPDGNPPATLLIDDLRDGSGAEASTGSVLTVHYVGVSWSTGEQFDASWDRNQPFQLRLGVGEVIEGWDIGLQGMKVGGQRRITIPPDLAYGPDGIDGAIAGNETLVFVVDLLSVE